MRRPIVFRRLGGLAAAGILVAACSESTGPDSDQALLGTWSLGADVVHFSWEGWNCSLQGTLEIARLTPGPEGTTYHDLEGSIARTSTCSTPDQYDMLSPANVPVTGRVRSGRIEIEEPKNGGRMVCKFSGTLNYARTQMTGSAYCSYVISIIQGSIYEGSWHLSR